MKKPEQGPRVYSVQDQMDTAKHFDYNVSTDDDEIALRVANAGKDINIHDDQTVGTLVGHVTLERLDDLGDKILWAKAVGGAAFNSARYMFRKVDRFDPRTFRRFPLARFHTKSGQLISVGDFRRTTALGLAELEKKSQEVTNKRVAAGAPYNWPKTETRALARGMSASSMRLSAYGFDPAGQDEDEVAHALEGLAISMHQDVMATTVRTGYNPSLAQLRTDDTPLGHDILRQQPARVVRVFKETSRELGADRGY